MKSVAGGLLWIGMRHDHDMTNRRLDAVILAGGCAHRLGGVSKANLRVGTRRLLDVVLDAVDGAVKGWKVATWSLLANQWRCHGQ